MSWFSSDFSALLAVAVATLDEQGTLLEANAGFALLVNATSAPIGARVDQFFIQPNFATLLKAAPDAQGNLHRGLLTMGDYLGQTRSVRARVWRADGRLRLLAEHDIADLHRLNDTVLALNRDYADAQLALARANLDMRQLNATLEQRVTERTAALREALHGAETASRAKSAFLATVSHELRTPLNAILGFAHVVGRELTDPKLLAQVETIGRSGRQLLGMIDKILDASSLEAGSFHLEEKDFSLPALLEGSLDTVRAAAQAKGLLVTIDTGALVPAQVHGDAARIGQIIASLLDNAVKFSGQGRITLRARVLEHDTDSLLLRLEVEDQGIGIGADEQAMLFKRFEQADSTTTRKHGGIGISLALCRLLAERMGGTIGLSSTPGRGSRFWFTVRLKPAPAAMQAHEDASVRTRPAAAAPQPSPVAAPLPADALQAVLGRLDDLLAQSDTAAIALFEEHAGALKAAMGAAFQPLSARLQRYDFDAARAILATARAAVQT